MDTSLLPSVPLDIEAAVLEAVENLNGKAREEFLQRFFRGDPQGLARIRRLMKWDKASSSFFLEAREHQHSLAEEILASGKFEQPVSTEEANAAESPGKRIGPYRLLKRIGEGGCGVVYEAEQEEPFHRKVALKVIRLGMDTESVIARFEAERQALALMDHPNIARVFDAGATSSGRPYFVMELVAGERITECCNREKLTIVDRIQLFIQVCQAIQHAHLKGLIHRDIKPSNVLVTMQDSVPVPKVIDFGIAKATGSFQERGKSFHTSQDQLIGTPPYMSPEQIDMSARGVDTRSDVYSLGALLYELLGGRAPFAADVLADAGISEMRRIVLEDEPPRLHRMLMELPPEELSAIAEARREDPARLIAKMHGDLDEIVAMAIAKDPAERYQTVNSLHADLTRFLDCKPVKARRPSRLYLAGKFVRRNRVVCTLGAAIALSVLGGLGASSWMFLNERRALIEQERLRFIAETARARETHLREQAHARANVSLAAVMLSENRINDADALLQKTPLESIEPSREAADVFRLLGNWNAIYGRWDQTVQCLTLLDQANRLDDPLKIVEGTDLLAIAPTLRAYGGYQAYENFRQQTLDLYLPARNPLQAEHLLKACLLAPAGPDVLARLKNAAHLCAQDPLVAADLKPHPEWNAFSLCLYFHRLNDPEKVLEWATRCLTFPDLTGSRTSATLCLTAMAHSRMGNLEAANRDLIEARRLVERAPKSGEALSSPTAGGFWFSWLVTRLLIAEAQEEIASHG